MICDGEYSSIGLLCGTVADITRAEKIQERKRGESALSFILGIPNASFWIRTANLRGRKLTKAARREFKTLQGLAAGRAVSGFEIAKIRDEK